MAVVHDLTSLNTTPLTFNSHSRTNFVTAWLDETLQQHNINTESWGQGSFKTVDHLRDEIMAGEARLDLVDGRLHRVCSVVRLDVRYSVADYKFLKLVEVEQVFSDGRKRDRPTDYAIWEKLVRNENPDRAVFRAIKEELGIKIGRNQVVIKGRGTIQSQHEDYPGLPSILTSMDYDLLLTPTQYNQSGYLEEQKDKTTYFGWKAA